MAQRGPLERVVVVGASLAGLRACETLRSEGFDGTITLVGAEQHPPYDRPPLSKQLLAGEWDVDRIWHRPPDQLAALGLTTRFGVPAAGLDLGVRSVVLADGTEVAFDGLIIATGARPRRLPEQSGIRNVFELRTLDDALALRDAVHRPGAQVVVIGAGFIGLEVAATARRAGADVTVIEAAPAPLIRGAGPDIGPLLAAIHEDEGVSVHCGETGCRLIEGAVMLGDGTMVAADVTVVGIGVSPATGWLDGSGLELRDGVVTSPSLSAAPRVYAAGDVARWTSPTFDEEMRVEHWTNADEQGAHAARNLLAEANGGDVVAFEAVPYVWSDQYDHRIQAIGRTTSADGTPAEADIVVGSPDERRFLAVFHAAGRLRGVVALNLPRQLMKYRRLIQHRAPLADALTLAEQQRAKLG